MGVDLAPVAVATRTLLAWLYACRLKSLLAVAFGVHLVCTPVWHRSMRKARLLGSPIHFVMFNFFCQLGQANGCSSFLGVSVKVLWNRLVLGPEDLVKKIQMM